MQDAAFLAEVAIHHLDEAAFAEDDNTVTRLQLGFTIDESTLVRAANVTAKGDSCWQMEFINRFRTCGAAFLCNNLCHIGTGYGKALDILGIGVEHHLIDASCCYHLLVDDGTYIELLRHRDIVCVIDQCNGLAHSHALGGKASQDVGLRLGSEGTEGLHVGEAFLK